MRRVVCFAVLSAITAMAGFAHASAVGDGSYQLAQAGPTVSGAAPAGPSPAPAPALAAPAGETLTLLCKGTYYLQGTASGSNQAPAAGTTQATQFTIKLSYGAQYMDLIASEWPALKATKENPAVVRSIQFMYDDGIVRAMFEPVSGNEMKGTLRNMGLGKLAGDYKEIITVNRKTGDFTYPNTNGRCEKVEAQVKENKF